MSIKKRKTHYKTDVQGTPDEWAERQLKDVRKAQKSAARRMTDTFAEIADEIKRNGKVAGGFFRGDDD